MSGQTASMAKVTMQAPHMQQALIAELRRMGVDFSLGKDGEIIYDPADHERVTSAEAAVIRRATPDCFVMDETLADAEWTSETLRSSGIQAVVTPGVALETWYVSWDKEQCEQGKAAIQRALLDQFKKSVGQDVKDQGAH